MGFFEIGSCALSPIACINKKVAEYAADKVFGSSDVDVPGPPSGPSVKQIVADQQAASFSTIPATYYRRAPHPWKGYVHVMIRGLLADSRGTKDLGLFTNTPITLPAKLFNFKGAVAFAVVVHYNVVYPNADPEYTRQGFDILTLRWEYQVYKSGSIEFTKPEFVHSMKSDEPHFDYSTSLYSPDSEKRDTYVKLQLRTTAVAFSQASGSVSRSETKETTTGGSIGGDKGGISRSGSRSTSYQVNPSVMTAPIANWPIPDLLCKISLEIPPIPPDPKPVPKPAPRPKLPDGLEVSFSPEGETKLDDKSTAAIFKWTKDLMHDPSKAWMRELLQKKRVKIYVDGYASKTGPEGANYATYSQQRARAVGQMIQQASAQDLRDDGGTSYGITPKIEGFGVAPWAKTGPDPYARVVKVHFNEAEVYAALATP